MKTKFERGFELVLSTVSVGGVLLAIAFPTKVPPWILFAIGGGNIVISMARSAIAAHFRRKQIDEYRSPVIITYTLELGGEVTTGTLTYKDCRDTKDPNRCKYRAEAYSPIRCAVHPEAMTCDGCRDFEND